MTWQNYPKDVQEKLRSSPAIRDAVDNMIKRGYPKETICRVTGAPYEVVDAQIHARAGDYRESTNESELRESSAKMTAERKAPRVVKPSDWSPKVVSPRSPLAKVERTPAEQEAFNRRMEKARAARGKKA